jgi:hypothetical protein
MPGDIYIKEVGQCDFLNEGFAPLIVFAMNKEDVKRPARRLAWPGGMS